jgi:hypothetical protein
MARELFLAKGNSGDCRQSAEFGERKRSTYITLISFGSSFGAVQHIVSKKMDVFREYTHA